MAETSRPSWISPMIVTELADEPVRQATRCRFGSASTIETAAPYTVRGYVVLITLDSDGVHHVTCLDLPQLSVSYGSLNGALTLTEDEIGAILAARDQSEP